jgi:hypothetical protein
LRKGVAEMSEEEINLIKGKRYDFRTGVTNSYISREDINDPLKAEPYYVGGPRGFHLDS